MVSRQDNHRTSPFFDAHRRVAQLVCGLLLFSHAALLAWGAYRHSPGIDEWGHLPAGLMHWREGRFDVYRVNPPLVRMIAALPLLGVGPKIDWEVPKASGIYRPELNAAIAFCLRYGAASFPYFTVARLVCIPFSLLGAWFCYRWACELYGESAGLIATGLWCFSPNILANAQMITPDAPAASLGLAASYAFWRWLGSPRWSLTVLVGIALGLSLSTKTTWLILPPVWLVLWLAAPRLRVGSPQPRHRQLGQVALILAIALYVVNALYSFDGSFTQLGKYEFVSAALRDPGEDALPESPGGISGNRFRGALLGVLPVPLPRDYVLGVDRQKLDFESHFPSYLAGKWRQGGWWYYYLFAMAIKMPLGTLALLALALTMHLYPPCRPLWRSEVFLLAPAIAILGFVSSQTGFSHHLRYVLPSFPYLFILASKPFGNRAPSGRLYRWLARGLMAWSVASSLSVYPHSMSYFNELVGGPRGGHAYLLDSNIDWGQDLIYLREWFESHPEAKPTGVALTLSLPSQLAGLDAPPPPKNPQPGWFAVSVNRMHSSSKEYAYFLHLEPVAMAGYSVYIFHIAPAVADRLRRGLRLAELGGSNDGRGESDVRGGA